jgi:DNA-binding SARP family transcriptional activator
MPRRNWPVLTLTFFGSLQVRQGNTPLSGLNRREGSRVLAYLALEQGAPVAYRTLARIFWPSEIDDGDPDSGDFTSTRQAIYSLRKSLGPDAGRLENKGRGIVAFELEGADVDFLEFDRLVQRKDGGAWERAVALYRGPLLEGWNDKWVLDARARRLRSFERVVRALVEDARDDARSQLAEGWLRHALLVTAGDESWHRALLELLARQGRFDAAEAQYETLRRERERTGTQPEEETQRLTTRLRREARQAPPIAVRATQEHAGTSVDLPNEPALSSPLLAPSKEQQVALLYKRDLQPDETVMRLLEGKLTQAGYTVFIDQYVNAGMAWAKEIEQQVRNSYGVIALLSEIAVQSEMLDYEIETAHSAAQARQGLPMLLPIRVCYDLPLPSATAMADILNPLQQLRWRSAEDNDALVAATLRSLQNPPPLPATPRRLEPIGGGMPVDSPYYIERATDADFQQALAEQQSIVLVKGARQMGKTSLLARGLHQARQRGATVVRTDLQKFNRVQMESASSFLHALATTIALQVGLSPPGKETWDPDMGANLNMEIFLCEQVLGSFEGPLVWALDEVDRLFTCDFGSEIFGLFRAWYNERSLDPDGPWSRITLAIAYATEAHLFVSDLNQSPFNVGTHLTLDDFDLDEVAELNRRCGSPLPDRASLERLYALIGGQPYLTRRALHEMAVRGMTLDTLEAKADRDEGVFGDHLRRLLTALSQDDTLTQIVRSMLHGQPCPTPESFYRLRSAGVLAGEWGEEIGFRCRIYSTYLIRRIP